MSKKFNCPACGKLMEYDGQTTLFQTCGSCGAPIVVPSEIVETSRDEKIESIISSSPSDFSYEPKTSFSSADSENLQSEAQRKIENFDVSKNARIYEEIKAGNKILAIKLYRETFGTDLLTAKNAVEAIEREVENPQSVQSQTDVADFTNLDKDQFFSKISEELRVGRKINAIKIYREFTGCGLAEAKNAVEKIESQTKYAIKGFPQNFEARNITASIGSNSQLGLIKNELRLGNKINAIKVFRETYKTGLKEAKNAVEAMERGEEINISDYL